jgi:S-DNA-T family DNA segregation ATPase FtsK/SpoIIIE
MAKKNIENKVIITDFNGTEEVDSKPTPKTKPATPEEKRAIKPFRFLKNERVIKSIGLGFIFLSVVVLLAGISFFSTWQSDQSLIKGSTWGNLLINQPEVSNNLLGMMGAWIGYLLIYKGFGLASFALVLILFAMGVVLVTQTEPIPVGKTLRYSFFAGIWMAIASGFIFPDFPLLGGSFGYFGAKYLSVLMGAAGTLMAIVLYALVFLVAVFNIDFYKAEPLETQSPIEEEEASSPFVNSIVPNVATAAEHLPFNTNENETIETEDIEENIELKIIEEEATELTEETPPIEEPAHIEIEPIESTPIEPIELTKPVEPEIEAAAFTTESGLVLEVQEIDEEELLEDPEHRTHFGIDEPYDPTLEFSHYTYPHLDLLNDYGDNKAKVESEELSEKTRMIEDTLKNYGIGIKKISATIGPTVTLYEIVPQDGVRIAKIKNLEDDIALSLAALGIRIIAPIPGKGTIGIEVPNLSPAMVSIRSVLASPKFVNADMDLPVAFGKTISNEVFVTDLAKMPHLLMAGATGQGKSVGLNTLLVSLLYKKHPSQIKFVLVDPKKVELNIYKTIERHFLAKIPGDQEAIITDTKLVVHTLNSLCKEMDDRYDLLKDAQVRNLKEYNAKFLSRRLPPTDKNKHRFLPYIVVVIDELADLMMTAGKEVELPIARLAQLARAIGIHLILATQRPSVNIITGTIKANFPARVAFRVSQKIDSRTILDANGADQLIGKGDMLFSNGNDLIRLQCAFVDTPEVEKITSFIGNQSGNEPYLLPLIQTENEDAGGSEGFDSSNRDDLFEEAARMIVLHQQGSTSLLQRKLNLGYNRAGRLIDQLEKAGIVGSFKGSKAREVMVHTELELEEILKSLR